MNRVTRSAPKQLKAIQAQVSIKGSAKGERPTGTTPRTHFEVRAKQLAKKAREQTTGFNIGDLNCAMKGNGRNGNATGAQTWFGSNLVDIDRVMNMVRGWFR